MLSQVIKIPPSLAICKTPSGKFDVSIVSKIPFPKKKFASYVKPLDNIGPSGEIVVCGG